MLKTSLKISARSNSGLSSKISFKFLPFNSLGLNPVSPQRDLFTNSILPAISVPTATDKECKIEFTETSLLELSKMREVFSDLKRYQRWLDVEAGLAQVQSELGIIPKKAAEEIAKNAKIASLDFINIQKGFAD